MELPFHIKKVVPKREREVRRGCYRNRVINQMQKEAGKQGCREAGKQGSTHASVLRWSVFFIIHWNIIYFTHDSHDVQPFSRCVVFRAVRAGDDAEAFFQIPRRCYNGDECKIDRQTECKRMHVRLERTIDTNW